MTVEDFELRGFKPNDRIAFFDTDNSLKAGVFLNHESGSKTFTFHNYSSDKEEVMNINSTFAPKLSDDFSSGKNS